MILARIPCRAELGGAAPRQFRNGEHCDLTVPPGTTRSFYVVFLPDGGTRAGISGAEFQLDTREAPGYLVTTPQFLNDPTVILGNPLSGGTIVTWNPDCRNGLAIPLMRFDVLNLGSGSANAPLYVREKNSPSNTNFPCALVNLCNAPVFSSVCVSSGVGFLNASGEVACGSGAQKRQWTGVKALYR